ncbi:DUF1887 family CARF protein [Thermosyntropha sp.]|uniref:Card1-like endonuclease domain-containing protein n=1 Tax=Thermosyntropha sp. TaxID=2740820 RepID=UPI0025FCFE4D|nr:DUF1887 family CARF protein [Thermosyntropha sp.]MBO8159003.1 DUF1887 family protein [Thermosyntropha sp.]
MANKILVLTVGTNPLPSYVVGKYLNNYDKLVLIHSEKKDYQKGTYDYAQKIKSGLEKYSEKTDYFFIKLENVSDPKEIRRDLKNGINACLCFKDQNEIEEIHLNYTGGTKTMAVHIYNFFKENYNDKLKASYLDARNYKLVFEDGTVEPSGKKDLRDYVKISIDELLQLHLYKKCEENSLDIKQKYKFKNEFGADNFEKISHQIEYIVKNEKSKDFTKWLSDVFRKVFKNGNDILRSKRKFIEHIEKISEKVARFDNETPDFVKDLLKAFPEKNRIIDEKQGLWRPGDDINNHQLEKRIKPVVEFLNGRWLEWYIYSQTESELLSMPNELQEGEQFGLSLEARKASRENTTEFELDMFVLYGYQLIGISVTTAEKRGTCKLKGFEVIHRVKQIGGDESKAILVTGLGSGTKSLEDDLAYETGSAEGKIKVFGIEDWKDIGKKIVQEVFK